MRACLYARVSNEEQADGYSVEAQLEAMRKFCVEQGWAIEVEYVEPGFTATTDERPVFKLVLQDCEEQRFDVLITHKLDRAFRSLLDQLQRLTQLQEWGVTYVSVVEKIDYSTPHGKMFMSMLGALNQYFSDNLSTEVTKGKKGRVRAGKANTSTPPHGYIRIDKEDVVDQEAALAIRTMFSLYATGKYSYQRLADELNRGGYKSSSTSWSKGRWTYQSVRWALKNPFYKGEVAYKEQTFPGEHIAIIDEALWDRVQAVIARRTKRRPSNITRDIYLLRGVGVCIHCGYTLYCERHGTPRYYRDSASQKGFRCKGKPYVRAEVLEEQVEEAVLSMRLPPLWRSMVQEVVEGKEQARQVTERREELSGKLARLQKLYIDGDITRYVYREEREAIMHAMAMNHLPASLKVQNAGALIESLPDMWPDMSMEERYETMCTVFESVDVDMKTLTITGFHPNHEFVPIFRVLLPPQ